MQNNNDISLFDKEIFLTFKNIDKNNFSFDKISILRELIRKHEINYPNILTWFDKKVVPGFKYGERIGYIGFANEIPVASAILKLGKRAKFCHLYIDPKHQNYAIGDIFFCQMTIDAKRYAKDIYFTLPERLWTEKINFFKSFGFKNASISTKKYRNSEEELFSTAEFSDVWKYSLEKIQKINAKHAFYKNDIQNGIIISIKPEYAQKIISGEKQVEIRRSFNAKLKGCKAAIYSSKPKQELNGFVTLDKIEKDKPENIWRKYKDKIACTEQDYLAYTKDTEQIFSIHLKNFEKYIGSIPLSQLSYLLDDNLRPPQSYYLLKNNTKWSNAISIIDLMHKKYKISTSI